MRLAKTLITPLVLGMLLAACGSDSNGTTAPTSNASSASTATRTIVMVWDGLRPDSVNATDTPNLYALRQSGVNFSDNHSTYPTFTMMNSSSFATGAFPKTSGFYGNTFWTPPQGSAGTIPAGNGVFGQKSRTSTFTIGRSMVSKVNMNTHQLRVFRDGKLVRTIPITTGQQPKFTTRSGTKVIIEG